MSQTDEAAQGTFETPKDAGKGGEGQVKLWLAALDLQDREERIWRLAGGKTIDIYRDAAAYAGEDLQPGRNKRYNILYSNTDTMAPALYNSSPIPDIRRRFADEDPAGKIASQILERAISYSIDQYDFDSVMRGAVMDLLLPGRAVTRVRYKPVMGKKRERVGVVKNEVGYYRASDLGVAEDQANVKKDDQGFFVEGNEYDAVTYEEVCCEHVQWSDFRRGPGKTWDEVPWVAFRHYLTRAEVKKLNPSIGATIPLDIVLSDDKQDGKNNQKPTPDIFKRLLVWEIWDKGTKKVSFIAPSYKDSPLKVEDDPLELEQFFPIPRPLYAVSVPETLVPVEMYRLYRDQAEELDVISRRLTRLTRACRFQGIYAAAAGDDSFVRLKDTDDGDYVPSQTAFNFAQNGGIGNFVWEKPVDKVSQVIDCLSMRQEQVKNNIYEIMGIADILRGSTKASETASAQNIKAQWGSLRLQKMQNDVQRYARDLFRLMGEIIANKFAPETLEVMTGIQLVPQAQKQQAMMIAQQAQATGQPVPEDVQKFLAIPSREEVMALLRNDAVRSFRVDIETDSTIQADTARFQKNLAEFAGAFGPMSQGVITLTEGGVLTPKAGVSFMQALARGFKLPRQAMDALEEVSENPPQQNAAEAQKAQAEQARTQADIQKTQLEGQIAMTKAQAEERMLAMEMEFKEREHSMKMEQLERSHALAMEKLVMQASMPKPEPAQAPN